jgi:hypothetical protein
VGLMTDPDWSSSASRRRGFVFHRLPLRRQSAKLKNHRNQRGDESRDKPRF